MFILLLRNMTTSKINFIYTFGNTTKQISTKFQYSVIMQYYLSYLDVLMNPSALMKIHLQ